MENNEENKKTVPTVTLKESLFLKIIDVLDSRDSKAMRGLTNQLEYLYQQAKEKTNV